MPAKKSPPPPKQAAAAANPAARAHAKIAALCLALPETTVEIKWDSPHFCVRGKIFASFGVEDAGPVVTFKTDPLEQQELLRDTRYFFAPYVGRFGWVGMRLQGTVDWAAAQAGIERSYALIACGKKVKRKR